MLGFDLSSFLENVHCRFVSVCQQVWLILTRLMRHTNSCWCELCYILAVYVLEMGSSIIGRICLEWAVGTTM